MTMVNSGLKGLISMTGYYSANIDLILSRTGINPFGGGGVIFDPRTEDLKYLQWLLTSPYNLGFHVEQKELTKTFMKSYFKFKKLFGLLGLNEKLGICGVRQRDDDNSYACHMTSVMLS